MTWSPEWRIAAALARHAGHDWGRWAYGETASMGKCRHCIHPAHTGMCFGRNGGTAYVCPCIHCCLTGPVRDPTDVEAYLADRERRGVEPGPLPSLTGRSEDGYVRWGVMALSRGAVKVEIRCGHVELGSLRHGRWFLEPESETSGTADEWHRVAEMARVVEEAMR